MVNIEIDGQQVITSHDATIMNIADELGIYIPRLCYHEKLSIIAACRLCLVEIIGVAKLVTACSTTVTSGMKILTNSPKVIVARQSVLELLLINHPLDCPVCDKSGNCELQDVVMRCGVDHSSYQEEKRIIAKQDFGPFIKAEMNRCIHCMKCVRYCDEIAQTHDLSVTGYGEHTTIIPSANIKISKETARDIIDLCPVGALLAKPLSDED